MPRALGNVPSHRRRKKLLAQAKGYRGARRTQLRTVHSTVIRAKAYATRDRKLEKRVFRNLWILRLSAAVRAKGWSYSRFIAAVKRANVQLDRKQLSELAINEPQAFDAVFAAVTTN
jgi:large subunit ribosomal protein L20